MTSKRSVRALVGSSLAAVTLLLGAGQAQAYEAAPATFEGLVDGPNYHWRTDPQAQVMAQHLGPVLHRVPGSWFNAPDIPNESRAHEGAGQALFGPGTPIFIGGDKMCTLAVSGFDQQGNKVGITAGHCGSVGAPVFSADARNAGVAGHIVQVVPEKDFALIQFNEKAQVTRSYGGVTINAIGGQAAPMQNLCKKGVATGFTCGPAWDAYNSQVCAMQGDSGAPMMLGDRLIGVVSGGNPVVPAGACTTPWQGPLHMPTLSTPIDVILAHLNAQGGTGAGFYLA
ncbi:S1 family peptidase [Corynebacterium sp. H130]|uniref:S1 family peptidase n=1 Tax=Corynebacterium sp. H130 TaxID=3133444 RepID=UPI0030AF126D